MKLYRLLVSFGAALAATFGSGYLCTLVIDVRSDWYVGLIKPSFMPSGMIITLAWPTIFALFIAALTLSVIRRPIRKSLISWGVILCLNPLWCLCFFMLNLPLVSLGLLLLMISAHTFTAHFYIKNTKEVWLLMIPILTWYVFLFIINYGIVMMN